MNTKEEIILNALNEDVSSYIHLAEHDRKCLAHTIALRLEAHDESLLELKRKAVSDEISAKLDLLTELGSLHDKLKKIPITLLYTGSRRICRFIIGNWRIPIWRISNICIH